jgi:hypothetical protein
VGRRFLQPEAQSPSAADLSLKRAESTFRGLERLRPQEAAAADRLPTRRRAREQPQAQVQTRTLRACLAECGRNLVAR